MASFLNHIYNTCTAQIFWCCSTAEFTIPNLTALHCFLLFWFCHFFPVPPMQYVPSFHSFNFTDFSTCIVLSSLVKFYLIVHCCFSYPNSPSQYGKVTDFHSMSLSISFKLVIKFQVSTSIAPKN